MKSVGKGNVERRGPESWRLRVSVVRDDGTSERMTKTVKCRTKTEARKSLDEWRAELLTKVVDVRREGITLGEYLGEYLEYCRSVEKLSPSTLRGYGDIVKNRFGGALSEVALVDIKPYMLEGHYAELRKRGGVNGKPLSGKTVQSAGSFLRTALKRAVRLGYIASNPCNDVRLPGSGKPKTAVLTKEEVRRMLFFLVGCPDWQFATACLIALATGMRRGEVCGLRWRDVDFDSRCVRVEAAVVEETVENGDGSTLVLAGPKTEASERTVAIDDFTARWLQLHKARQYFNLAYYGIEQSEETPVCAGALGEWYRPDCFTKDFESFRAQHGFEVRLHDLRHTQASLLIEAGEDIVTVSRRLGHARVSTTLDIYSHLMPGKDRAAAGVIGGVFGTDSVA